MTAYHHAAGLGQLKGMASAKVLLDAFCLLLRLIAGAVSFNVSMSTGFKWLITLSCQPAFC